jgi:hypothetical protein
MLYSSDQQTLGPRLHPSEPVGVELEESGFLSGDERRKVVEGGGPPGLRVVAAIGVRPVAQRHTRLGAVVDKLHARDRGLMHSHMRHRVRAYDDQLRLHQLDDLITDRELAAATSRRTIVSS